MAQQIPDAELVVLPKVAHTIGPRAATRLTTLLVPFLVADEGEIEEAAAR